MAYKAKDHELVLLEKTGQAPAPSKDFHQLIITNKQTIWRWWKISVRRNAIVYPGESKTMHRDFDYDEKLHFEIQRVFGNNVLEEAKRLSKYNGDWLASLPKEILLQIMIRLPLEDILNLSQVNRYLRYICSMDELWEEIYIKLCGEPSEEIRSLAKENGWKKTLFTDKLKLRLQLSRRRKDHETHKDSTFITSSQEIFRSSPT